MKPLLAPSAHLFLILFSFVSMEVTAKDFHLDQTAHLFPVEGFEDRVEFWKQIFAEYGRRDVVFHDVDDLRLIYDVEKFNAGPDSSSREARRQREKLRKKKKELENLFNDLIAHGPDSSQLSSDHEELVELLRGAGYSFSKSVLRRLRDNIRLQRGIKDKFEAGIIRSGLYLDRIQSIFSHYQLPLELTVLPHVESSFDYTAYSRAAAAGIWQFTRGTGRIYLNISRHIDERLDPIRSSDAAARLLRDNFTALGNWPLAITAYNHGKYGMLRAKRAHGPDLRRIIQNYQSRLFGFASKNFYAEFLAALEVTRNYESYFGPLRVAEPFEFDTIRLAKAYDSSYLTSLPDITPGVLTAYNPHLSRLFQGSSRVLPAGIEVRLPVGKGDSVMAVLKSAKPSTAGLIVAADGSMRYRVRRGEALGTIASRFGTSVRELQRLNGIRNANRIYPGQVLLVSARSSTPVPVAAPREEETVRYQVRSGDSLTLIAKRFNTSVRSIQQTNGLSNPNRLRPGQVLVIEGSEGSEPAVYTVKGGDTLAQIAQRFGTSITRIIEANNLSNPHRIRKGQQLMIP